MGMEQTSSQYYCANGNLSYGNGMGMGISHNIGNVNGKRLHGSGKDWASENPFPVISRLRRHVINNSWVHRICATMATDEYGKFATEGMKYLCLHCMRMKVDGSYDWAVLLFCALD